jgi:hypothetical protein
VELSYEKWASDYTFAVPSQKKRFLEVIRRWLKRVVRGEFIDTTEAIDELPLYESFDPPQDDF